VAPLVNREGGELREAGERMVRPAHPGGDDARAAEALPALGDA
jgi:hypothetical protein